MAQTTSIVHATVMALKDNCLDWQMLVSCRLELKLRLMSRDVDANGVKLG